MFHHALRAFNLIPVETNSTVLPIGDGQGDRYCGVNYKDAESRCEPCVTNFDCRGKTLCHSEVGACNPNIPSALDRESTDSITSASSDYENSGDDVVDTPMSPMAMVADAVTTLTTNYCGGSWGDAATTCAKACPSGKDSDCAPGQYCFGDITACSSNTAGNVPVSNYCGVNWADAHATCLTSCPGGTDAECPLNQNCFGDIHC